MWNVYVFFQVAWHIFDDWFVCGHVGCCMWCVSIVFFYDLLVTAPLAHTQTHEYQNLISFDHDSPVGQTAGIAYISRHQRKGSYALHYYPCHLMSFDHSSTEANTHSHTHSHQSILNTLSFIRLLLAAQAMMTLAHTKNRLKRDSLNKRSFYLYCLCDKCICIASRSYELALSKGGKVQVDGLDHPNIRLEYGAVH